MVSPVLIGVPRFELGTSPTRTERATRLRHTPRQRGRLAEEPGTLRRSTDDAVSAARVTLDQRVAVARRGFMEEPGVSAMPLAQEGFDRLGAEVWALADQEVAAIGDHA